MLCKNLFAYGSLRDPGLVKKLLGRAVLMVPAKLLGFKKQWPKNHYPKIIPSAKTFVRGVVLPSLSSKDFNKLDAYEGVSEGLYKRTLGVVEIKKKKQKSFYYIGDGISLIHDRKDIRSRLLVWK